MNCPICLQKTPPEEHELSIHVSLEPRFDFTRERVEVVLPEIIAIQCKGGDCLYPRGETLFLTLEMIYWAGAGHAEKIGMIRAHATRDIEIENRTYLDNLAQLTATLQEAVRRHHGSTYHPTS